MIDDSKAKKKLCYYGRWPPESLSVVSRSKTHVDPNKLWCFCGVTPLGQVVTHQADSFCRCLLEIWPKTFVFPFPVIEAVYRVSDTSASLGQKKKRRNRHGKTQKKPATHPDKWETEDGTLGADGHMGGGEWAFVRRCCLKTWRTEPLRSGTASFRIWMMGIYAGGLQQLVLEREARRDGILSSVQGGGSRRFSSRRQGLNDMFGRCWIPAKL